MILTLLIFLPVLAGIILFGTSTQGGAKGLSLGASLVTLGLAAASFFLTGKDVSVDVAWIGSLGARFSLHVDGMARMLVLLNAIALPLVIIGTWKNEYFRPGRFYGLMLLMQAGMMGVFLASDALLFYFFWELALIPAYFLCSIWGGEKRIPVTFKFFVYTFLGSLLMLAGILFLYLHTPYRQFSFESFVSMQLGSRDQAIGFWLFFLAFAVKMPVFPFHTWQPDTYEQSPTAVTMLLSGVMVKMGLFGVIRWILPIFPDAVHTFSPVVIGLSVTGILYASLIAIRQDDFKRLIAYSSIAHIGLMCAAIFAGGASPSGSGGLSGVLIQLFNHGINVIGLWIVADAIERQTGTRKFSELGGLALRAPSLSILLVLMALANIALPLTNSFAGEFLMLNGLFAYSPWVAAVAGVGVILSAVYTLLMVQKVIYGNTSSLTAQVGDTDNFTCLSLSLLVVGIIFLGVYPQPMIDLTRDTVAFVTNILKGSHYLSYL